MSIAEKNLSLKMVRANLDNVPEFALPAGFALRRYQPGDEAHWLRIHGAADRYNEITPELFRKQFGANAEGGPQSASTDEKRLSERQSYLLDPRGEAMGTGTAWFNKDFEGTPLMERDPSRVAAALKTMGQTDSNSSRLIDRAAGGDRPRSANWGSVHWVAIVPEYQGRGLSKPLMTAICRRLRELGHDRAYLSTSTARSAAIKLYLKFGFEPAIRCAEDEVIWKEVLAVCRG